MYTAKQVDALIAQWKTEGYRKSEIVVQAARSCLGWPYVFGARGEYCSPSKRRDYLSYNPDKDKIKTRCQVLNGTKVICDGCAYYLHDEQTRMFDCRGFTYWLLKQVGITLNGGGATTQFNDNSNWIKKGKIAEMPLNQVCCVFKNSGNTMEHTGMHIWNGDIIHCSGTVKKGHITDSGWTHYAIPAGLDEAEVVEIAQSQISVSNEYPTLRKGSKGRYVTLLQTELIKRGYDLGHYGADGDFGTKTEAAVRKFQADWGLSVDGIVGRKTWAYLNTPQEQKYVSLLIPELTNDEALSLIAAYPKASIVQGTAN